MEKRLLLAVGLSIAILVGTQYLARRYFPPSQPPPVKPAQKAVVPQESKPEKQAVAPVSVPQTVGTRRQLLVESAEYRAVVDSQGAVLRSFQLKKYGDKSGQPLELIPQKLPPQSFAPLALDVPGRRSLTQQVNQVVYEVRVGDQLVSEDRFTPPVDFVFLYRDSGIQVQKNVRFYPSRYTLEISAQLWERQRPQNIALLLGPDIGTEAEEVESDFQPRQVAVNLGGSVQREVFQSGNSHIYSEPVLWAGFDTKYFAALAIPVERFPSLKVNRFDVKRNDASGKESAIPYYRIHYPLAGEPLRLYLGPKDYDTLNAVKPGLADIIDYGWFSLFVKPLVFSLKFIYRFVANWGVAIILLTLFISVALFPVRYKQMVSMKKMQVLQPKMRSIQDRYKKYKRTDPKRQEMNAEIMALYKEHGVNPLGGCLPLLIQMPFLFAFYRMLDAAIELRGAPFLFWIRDLSRMDPYYVTPILMGATMVWQQKMTPQTTTDPAQARMMTMMPIIFTAMFLSLSSGLVLYFLFSNLFGIAIQKLAEKWMPVEGEAKGKKAKRVKE